MGGLCTTGTGSPGPSPGPTFCVVLVQLVGRLLPVLDALLQRVDEALQQRAVGGAGGSGSPARSPFVTRARQPDRGTHSLGELPQLGLDAAVAHAHARERRANVPCGPWRGKRAAWEGAAGASAVPASATRGRADHSGLARSPRPAPSTARSREAIPPSVRGIWSVLSICRDSSLCRTKALPMPAVPACCSCRCSGGQASARDRPKG